MRLLNFVDDGKIKLGIEKENKIIDVEKIALKYNADVPITMESRTFCVMHNVRLNY